MKVLLISPLRGLDPPCGDITYTEELVSHASSVVEYVTYDRAIADGTLIEVTRANWQIAPIILVLNKLINLLRRLRLLYWEPFRFFAVSPEVYDLVHVHVFPFRILNKCAPILYSAGAPTDDVYRDRRKFSNTRVKLLQVAESILCNLFKVNHASVCQHQIDCMAVYTDYFRNRIHSECSPMAPKVELVPISLADLRIPDVSHVGVRYGIVAYEFSSKGGETLLRAFRQVRELDTEATLHIVGNVPDYVRSEDGVLVNGVMDRSFVINEFLPAIDVFVYPTPHDCFSYVMLEAMRCGRAICTSDYVSMPEAVDYGNAGLISPVGDVETLASNMIEMLNIDTRRKYQIAARQQFLKKFDSAVVLAKLFKIYSDLVLPTVQPKRNTD